MTASGNGRRTGLRDNPAMSYDLAVWDGDPPTNDVAAGEEYDRLYEQYLEADEPIEPTPRIAAYVAALLDHYPDADRDSPWSAGQPADEASGPIVYLTMVWSQAEEVSAVAARLAEDHGLNCYDPQSEQLRGDAASGAAVIRRGG